MANTKITADNLAANAVTSASIADNSIGITQLNVSDGTNGQVLTTNGSGTLSFSTISGYTDSDVETYLDAGTSSPVLASLIVDTNTLYVDSTNNKLLSGTTTAPSGGSVNMVLAATTAAGIQLSDTAGNGGGAILNISDSLAFYTHSGAIGSEAYTKQMTITDGAIGIGTSNPSNLLHVNGSGDALKVGNGTRHLFVASDSGGVSLGNGAGQTGEFLYLNEAGGEIRLYTNGSQVLTIDSSGRTGLSQAYSPSHVLDIKNNSATTTPLVRVWNSNANWGAKAGIRFLTDVSDSSSYPESEIGNYRGDASGTPAGMYFSTGTSTISEKMKITTGGDILIGWSGGIYNDPAASSVEGISLRNPTGGNTATMIVAKNDSSAVHNIYSYRLGNSNYGRHIHFNHNGSEVGTINSTTSSTSYNTSSDYRLKENVVEMTGALDRVNQLQPKRFNFIVNPDTTVDGFLAHEVQEIVPEAITGVKDEMQEEEYEVTPAVLDEDGNVVTEAVMGTREVPVYQGIDQSKLVPLLTKAIQEQQTTIDDLKARIETLENA